MGDYQTCNDSNGHHSVLAGKHVISRQEAGKNTNGAPCVIREYKEDNATGSEFSKIEKADKILRADRKASKVKKAGKTKAAGKTKKASGAKKTTESTTVGSSPTTVETRIYIFTDAEDVEACRRLTCLCCGLSCAFCCGLSSLMVIIITLSCLFIYGILEMWLFIYISVAVTCFYCYCVAVCWWW
uniref:Uncharacterized protein n=1 Tax=Ditylenchus dipsaci TaxID=166011 RepID=A0A915D8S4_9BILA